MEPLKFIFHILKRLFYQLKYNFRTNLARYLTFAFLCLVWGTTWIGIKISLEGLPPFLGASLRFFIALIFLVIFILIKKITLKVSKRHLGVISLSAFLMYTLDYGLIYWGEQYLSAGVTSIFFATFPLFTGISAIFLLKNETFSWNKFIGLILGLLGVSVVFLDQLLQTEFDHQVILGSLAIIVGAASGAMSVVIVKKYLSTVNPVALSFFQMVQGVVFLFVMGFLLERSYEFQVNLRVGLAVVYLGAFGSALAFALYYWLLQKWSAVSLSVIVYIIPIVALFVDYMVLSELIHPRAILGMLIIFGGIAFVQLETKTWKKLTITRKKEQK